MNTELKLSGKMCCARQHLLFSSFARLFNICDTKRDGSENDIFFYQSELYFFTNQQEFTVTNAASIVVLTKAKNIVGHMPILHGMFRSAKISFPQAVWELRG